MKKDLPSGWSQARVEELADLIRGITYKKEQARSTFEQGYKPILRANNINGVLNFESLVYVPEELINEKQYIRKDDIVFAMSSGSKHLVGKSARAVTNFNGSYGAFCGLVRPSDKICKPFLFYAFQERKFRQLINQVSKGSNINNLKREHILDFVVSFPPINEQERIVTKIEELFSELDSGIASLKTAREQLKIYRQAVLKHAFEGKLTAQWRKENPDKLETPEQLLTRIQQERESRYQQQLNDWKQAVKDWEAMGKEGKRPSKPKEPVLPQAMKLPDEHYLADLPKSWIAIKAEHLCDFITKGTTPAKAEQFSNSGEIPFIKVYNLTRSGILDFSVEPTYVSQKTHEEFLARSKVFPNDVLMNIVGPPLGKVSIVPNTYPEWNINQAIAIYRSGILSPKYLAEFLLFERTVNHMMAQSKATAGQFNLTLEICRNLPIPVMSTGEQSEIIGKLEEKLSNIDAVSSEINDQLYKSETLRQSILKKAFSGQLVPQDPSDETASELLARIKAEKKSNNKK